MLGSFLYVFLRKKLGYACEELAGAELLVVGMEFMVAMLRRPCVGVFC